MCGARQVHREAVAVDQYVLAGNGRVSGELPPEHKAQVQGSMWVAERELWDFVSYWPKLPLFVKRVYRDNGYIATLASAAWIRCQWMAPSSPAFSPR